MGTRHLTCVVLNDEFRVAQYGQWDGYPSGQGATIYEFLKKVDLAAFKQRVAELKTLSEEEVTARWKECGATGEWVSIEVSKECEVRYPALSRDTGAVILSLIAKGIVNEVQLATDFAADGLFCEWAWVVDLDNDKLEVYRGCNREKKIEGRFAHLSCNQGHRSEKWSPVSLRTAIPIKDLPDYDVFLEMCNDPQEDDD